MAVAWVQTQVDTFNNTDGVSTSYTYTLLHAFTSGNTLVGCIFLEDTSNSITSITDNASPSNTYTLLDSTTQNVGADFMQSFALTNIIHVPTTITINLSHAPAGSLVEYMFADEISGANTIHKHAGLNNTSVTTLTSGNVTPTVNNCLFWGGASPTTFNLTAGTNLSYTLRINDTANGLFSETAIQSTAAAAAAQFVSTGSAQGGGCFVVVFDPSAVDVLMAQACL